MKYCNYFSSLFLVFFFACTSAHLNPGRINQSAIPNGFNDLNCVLLLEKKTSGVNPKGMNNYLNKSFSKYYTGKYEMASLEEIANNPKYLDTKIYRFVLTDQVRTSSSTTMIKSSSGNEIQYNNSYRIGYHLQDRLEGKTYPELGVSSNVPAKAMHRVASLLNSLLHK